MTALARYTLRTAAARRRSPAAILRWVDEAMLDQDAARGRYCTIACAHVDLTRSPARLTVSCGGHPLPVLRRADGAVEQVGAYGTLLGLGVRRGAARPLDRPAAGRHAGALHGRPDRGAGAALDVGTSEELAAAVRRGAGGRAARGSSRASSRARSASAPSARRPRRARAQAHGLASPSPDCPWPCRRRCRRPGRSPSAFPPCRCGVPSAGVSSTSGGCSSGYPISDSVVSIPSTYPRSGMSQAGCRIVGLGTPQA